MLKTLALEGGSFFIIKEEIILQKIIYVGIGGCIGAVMRYLVTMQSAKMINSNIPLGTLIVKRSRRFPYRNDNGTKCFNRFDIAQFKAFFNNRCYGWANNIFNI